MTAKAHYCKLGHPYDRQDRRGNNICSSCHADKNRMLHERHLAKPAKQTYRGGILTVNGIMAWCDDEDFDRLVKYSWRVEKNGYVRRWPHVLMHRDVLGLKKGESHVDHINHNPLDNQKSNLRLVTPSQNQWNRKRLPSDGIEYQAEQISKPWRGSVKRFRKTHHTKNYATREEAVAARRDLAIQLHGEYHPRTR